MAFLLLECKDDEKQEDFLLHKPSPSIREMTASFADGTILTEI